MNPVRVLGFIGVTFTKVSMTNMTSETTSLRTVTKLLGKSGSTARRFVEKHSLAKRRGPHIVLPLTGLRDALHAEYFMTSHHRAWEAYHEILGPRAHVDAAYLFELRMAEICPEAQAELRRVSSLPEGTPRPNLRYFDFVEFADVWLAWAPIQIAIEWLGGDDGSRSSHTPAGNDVHR